MRLFHPWINVNPPPTGARPPVPPNPGMTAEQHLAKYPIPLAANDPKLVRRQMNAYIAEGFTEAQAFALVLKG